MVIFFEGKGSALGRYVSPFPLGYIFQVNLAPLVFRGVTAHELQIPSNFHLLFFFAKENEGRIFVAASKRAQLPFLRKNIPSGKLT